MKQGKNGKRRTIWLSNELDEKAEKIRKELGLGHSAFYRFAVIELVKDFARNKIVPMEEQL
jgi:hypothetical protein